MNGDRAKPRLYRGMGPIASALGLVLGMVVGSMDVANSYGDPPTFWQGVVLTVLMIAWLAFTGASMYEKER